MNRKKLFCFLIVTCLLFTLSLSSHPAIAETETDGFISRDTFVLRNNISFGMTKDEVLQHETMKVTGQLKNSIQAKGESIYGYPNAGVHYDFDDNGKLYNVYYFFDNSQLTSHSKLSSEYMDVFKQLMNEFGAPMNLNMGKNEHYVVTGKGIDAYERNYAIGMMGKKFYTVYDEWVVTLPEGHVKIEHYVYYSEGKKSNNAGHYLYYQYFTNQEWEKALRAK